MNIDEDNLRQILRTELQATEARLETRLDTRLTARIDTRFAAQERRLDIQLAKFFGLTNRRLDKLEATKADRSQVEKLQATMDGIAGRLDTHDTERALTNHQLDRHERWFGELAKATGAALSPP